MTDKAKLIRTIYLYLASLISLLFVAIGAGRILNTALKYYVFPKAEKGGYSQCDVQPPIYALDKSNLERVATDDQKIQLENLLRDYEQWKKGNAVFNLDTVEKVGKIFEIEVTTDQKNLKKDEDTFNNYKEKVLAYLSKVVKGSNLDFVSKVK